MTYVLMVTFVTSGFFKGIAFTQFKTQAACEFVSKQVDINLSRAKCIAVDDSVKK